MSRGAELTVLAYASLVAALLSLELLAHRPGGGTPTFSGLLRWGMRRRDAQLALLLAWWWLGWHFLLNQ
jgi:hypothetical protein